MTREYRLRCPKCRAIGTWKIDDIDRREAAVVQLETDLREREQLLSVREAEYQNDVRLIRSCLHPDKHKDNTERYTKAWQAFDRLLESGRQPQPAVDRWTDEIPF
jgi:hypothetical protein